MNHHLQADILTNDTNYFFSLLGPRFDVATKLMAEALHNKFGVPFEPIYIYSATPNQHFSRDNYIVLNSQAETIEESSADRVIYLPEFEDLNIEFAQCQFIKELGTSLLKKQDKIYIYSFTTSFLDLELPNWVLLGPNPKVVKRYDNKVDQYLLFSQLNLPRNQAEVFSSLNSLQETLSSKLPCYVTASYASGGNESGLVYSPDMLNKIFSGLRTPNRQDRFLASKVFENLQLAPNASAIITGPNQTQLLVISDQILSGTRYLGNIYPSQVTTEMSRQIQEIMLSIGNHLSQEGYRGFFGCDFLVDDQGNLATVDLNPRRQGGYLCNALALKSMGVDLLAMELDCALDGYCSTVLDYAKIQYPRVWAHSKVKPVGPGQRLRAQLYESSPQDVFAAELPQFYAATFYEPGCMFLDGYIGYVITSGHDRTRVLQELRSHAERVLAASLHTMPCSSDSAELTTKAADAQGRDFRGADLRGIDLRRLYLSGSNLLRQADLRGVNLSGKDLSGADLRGANLIGANLEDANLQGANLEKAQLTGVSLRKANLQKAKLKQASLRGANLESANFQAANLEQAELQESTLKNANLQGALLKKTKLWQVNLQGTKLRNACLQEVYLQGANLQNTSLAHCNLKGAQLTGANLLQVNLQGACLENANLERTNLANAHLDKANLAGANLSRAELSDASLTGANLQAANFAYSNLQGANLKEADLTGANLSGAQLSHTVTALVPFRVMQNGKQLRNKTKVRNARLEQM